MGVTFTEGRGLPSEFSRGSGYEGLHQLGHFGEETSVVGDVAKVFDAVSPWKLLEGIFVTKPAAERAAQVAIAEAQVKAQGQAQYARAQSMKTLLMYGGGAVGALVLVILLTKRRAPAVGSYRRSRRSRRSRR